MMPRGGLHEHYLTHFIKKVRCREPHGELGVRPLLYPLPFSHLQPGEGGVSGGPQGSRTKVSLPGSRGLLPAHMPPNGGPVAGPRSMASPLKQLCCGEGRPIPPCQPPVAPCIFHDVYYSCFISGKEPEQLVEEPRTDCRGGQWSCSTQPGELSTPSASACQLHTC